MAAELYWSEGFMHMYVASLNSDEAFQKAARKFDETLVFRCLDTAEGLDVEQTYRIEKGKVSVVRRAEPSPSATLRDTPFDKSKSMARTTAPFSIWVKLDKGEMNVLQAISAPDYAVDGSKLKIMKSLPVLNAMSACSARLSKRYQ